MVGVGQNGCRVDRFFSFRGQWRLSIYFPHVSLGEDPTSPSRAFFCNLSVALGGSLPRRLTTAGDHHCNTTVLATLEVAGDVGKLVGPVCSVLLSSGVGRFSRTSEVQYCSSQSLSVAG